MSTLPPDLSASLPSTEDASATAWWNGLSHQQRSELAVLCDPLQDDCFFGVTPEGGEPPTVRGGRFLPHDDAWGLEEWGPEWFDHLLEHPELVTMWEVERLRTFHICTRHPAARATLAVGRIPADFVCPFDSADCLMRRLIDSSAGNTLRLIGMTTPDGTRRVLVLPTV